MVIFQTAWRGQTKKNTVEVFLPCKACKANLAEKNWIQDSFQKQKKGKCGNCCYVSTVWPFIQEFLQLVWTLHTSTDFLLHMTGAQQTASSRPRKMDTSWELWENIHHVALWNRPILDWAPKTGHLELDLLMFPSIFYQSSQPFNHPTSSPNPLLHVTLNISCRSLSIWCFFLRFAAIRRSKSSNQKAVATHPLMIINASGWVPQHFGTAKACNSRILWRSKSAMFW